MDLFGTLWAWLIIGTGLGAVITWVAGWAKVVDAQKEIKQWKDSLNTQIRHNLELNEHINHLESATIHLKGMAWEAYNKFKQVVKADESHIAQRGKNFLHPTLVSELRTHITGFEEGELNVKWKPLEIEFEDNTTQNTSEAQ